MGVTETVRTTANRTPWTWLHLLSLMKNLGLSASEQLALSRLLDSARLVLGPHRTQRKLTTFQGHIGQAFFNLGFWIIKRLSSQTKAGKPVTG